MPQSPWLKRYIEDASAVPLPLLPELLDEFPSRWPFPRGDLFHWIPLLNRFDSVLEAFCSTYALNDGPQSRDLTCELLLKGDDTNGDRKAVGGDMKKLELLGYGSDGDRHVVVRVLSFTQMLLEHCGNRSIYASSAHLNSLLNSTDLNVLMAALEVGVELAKRYQASLKKMQSGPRGPNSSILKNHYDIDLERVRYLAQPFVKTSILNVTDPFNSTNPGAAGQKGKEKQHGPTHRNVASMYANDLATILKPSEGDASSSGHGEESEWAGWGDVKLFYLPSEATGDAGPQQDADRPGPSSPGTPTPLRRSVTLQQSPRANRHAPSDDISPPNSQPVRPVGVDENVPAASGSGLKTVEIRAKTVMTSSIYELNKLCPTDVPKGAQYLLLTRLRVAKALLGSVESRQQALAVRLLAITNLSYIHNESTFVDLVLKQDSEEPRRFQLVYQLVDLIHPTQGGEVAAPIWLQSIALALLEGIAHFAAKITDVLSALNANVNHGVLLYVIRKAVDMMKEDETGTQLTPEDQWRANLFSLALLVTAGPRVPPDNMSQGLIAILVETLTIRSTVAERNYSMILTFLDGVLFSSATAFQAFVQADGLDAITNLVSHQVQHAKELSAAGLGTRPKNQSSVVDYEIPYYQQQTLKWLLRYLHHIMVNAYAYGGGVDRLLRNLVDKSDLLRSIREIIESIKMFGSMVWTNAVSLVGDFINHDPTSFTAISEAGMIQSLLETLTGNPLPAEVVAEPKAAETAETAGNAETTETTETTAANETGENNENDDDDDPSTPSSQSSDVSLVEDEREHPPTEETLNAERPRPIAHGILPSSEAISIVPSVLNCISLNNQGLKMVVASRIFDSYFEIFESPKHVQVMESDPDLASSIGSSFDELARHHPALRDPISNAVIDMVARVEHLGRVKAKSSGWGVRLFTTDADGNVVTADKSLIERPAKSVKGKEKAQPEDDDVEMSDGLEAPGAQTSSSNQRLPVQDSQGISPYISALAFFMSSYIANPSLKSNFLQLTGLDLLLDLTESPSLPYNYSTNVASRTLQHVISQLVEAAPILGLPSLLKRTQAAVDTLEPLVNGKTSEAFFAPFLTTKSEAKDDPSSWDPAAVEKLANGTKMAKALLKAQSLLKTLYQCFPYSTRSSAVVLHPVNVFDYYSQLLTSLGPLLKAVLTEEIDTSKLVPQHWTTRSSLLTDSAFPDGVLPSNVAPTPAEVELDEVQAAGEPAVVNGAEHATEETKSGPSNSVAKPEQSTLQQLNFRALASLLHNLTPTSLPFLQVLGKALLPRRLSDPYLRGRQIEIAALLGKAVLGHVDLSQTETKEVHYWIIMLHAMHEMIVDCESPKEIPFCQ